WIDAVGFQPLQSIATLSIKGLIDIRDGTTAFLLPTLRRIVAQELLNEIVFERLIDLLIPLSVASCVRQSFILNFFLRCEHKIKQFPVERSLLACPSKLLPRSFLRYASRLNTTFGHWAEVRRIRSLLSHTLC